MKKIMDRKFFYAMSVLVGTSVGVGIFAVPYVTAKAGFVWGLVWIVVIGLALMVVNLMYGEVILSTKGEKKQLASYSGKYLGKWVKHFSAGIFILGTFGTVVAYLIVGGDFLFSLLGPVFGGVPFYYSLGLFVFSALAIFFGMKLISRLELFMIGFLFLSLLFLFLANLDVIHIEHLVLADHSLFFLPFGTVLFALGGMSAVAEMDDILETGKKRLKSAIVIGSVIVLLATLFFAFVIVGITGPNTSSEAIMGLAGEVQPLSLGLITIFGILAIVTSFIAFGGFTKGILNYDYKINKTVAWAVTVFVPLAIFIFWPTSFIMITNWIGAFLWGIQGILMVFIYFQVVKKRDRRPEYSLKWPAAVSWFIILLFVAGMLYQVYSLVTGNV